MFDRVLLEDKGLGFSLFQIAEFLEQLDASRDGALCLKPSLAF